MANKDLEGYLGNLGVVSCQAPEIVVVRDDLEALRALPVTPEPIIAFRLSGILG